VKSETGGYNGPPDHRSAAKFTMWTRLSVSNNHGSHIGDLTWPKRLIFTSGWVQGHTTRPLWGEREPVIISTTTRCQKLSLYATSASECSNTEQIWTTPFWCDDLFSPGRFSCKLWRISRLLLIFFPISSVHVFLVGQSKEVNGIESNGPHQEK